MSKMRPQVDLDVDVYEAAKERCRYIFETFDHVAVSFSGGKDSTATLNVAVEVAHERPEWESKHLPMRAIFYDEEAIPYETEEYVRRVSQRDDVNVEWYCVPCQQLNAASRRSSYWWPWAPEAEALWCRPMPPEALTEIPGFPIQPQSARLSISDANGLLFPPSLGNVALLLGIRAQESLTRRRAVTGRNDGENYIIKSNDSTAQGNLWKVYPIYDWTTEDVWEAPAAFDWDYNRAYDLMEMAGVTHPGQRCSPAFGAEPILGLHVFSKAFPDVWEKMVDRVPGVGSAMRYAKTELYGYGSRPEKPADLSWPEFVQHYLRKFDGSGRKITARRIRTFIAQHYAKTKQPIAPSAAHPITGVSWDFLVQIAMRGDWKERKNVRLFHLDDDAEMLKAWTAYCDEIAQVSSEGHFDTLGHPGREPQDPYSLMPQQYRDQIDREAVARDTRQA